MKAAASATAGAVPDPEVVGLLPLEAIMPELMAYLDEVLPADALSQPERFLEQVAAGSGGGILSLGLLGALWATSSGLTAVMYTLSAVYNTEETRPFWKVRLMAMAMTIGLAGFSMASIALVLYGEYIGRWIADLVGLGRLFVLAWSVLQWP